MKVEQIIESAGVYQPYKLSGEIMQILERGMEIISYILILLIIIYILLSIYYFKRLHRLLFLDRFLSDAPTPLWARIQRAAKAKKTKYKGKAQGYKEPTGMVFGVLPNKRLLCSPSNKEGHAICLGTTGSSKTTGFITSTLRHWDGHFFTIDFEGDLLTNTGNWRNNKLIFAPWNDKCQGYPFDVYYPLRRPLNNEQIYDFFRKLGFSIVPENPKGNGTDTYFLDGARNMLIVGLYHFWQIEEMEFIPAIKLISMMTPQSLLEAVVEANDEKTYGTANNMLHENEKNLGGCKSQLDKFIECFATRDMMRNCIRRAYKHEKPITPQLIEKYDIFCCIPMREIVDFAPLLRLIAAQFLEYFKDRDFTKYPQRLLFVLDEFGSIGQIRGIKETLATVRKRGVNCILATQGLNDLKDTYGEEYTLSMLGNCTHTLCFQAKEKVTAEFIAEQIGKDYEDKETMSWGVSNDGVSAGNISAKDYIIEPTNMQYLPRDNKVIYIGPDGYYLLRRYLSYEHEEKDKPKFILDNAFLKNSVKPGATGTHGAAGRPGSVTRQELKKRKKKC